MSAASQKNDRETNLSGRLRRADRFQQRHRSLSFAVAVLKKYTDDQAGSLGALIAFYGFSSLFPLLLVFATVLGFILQGNPDAQASVLHSTLSQFPVIGTQLRNNIGSLHGSLPVLVVGLIGSTLGGLGITGATQNAFDQIWYVPHKRRANFLISRARGLALLALLGALAIMSTAASAVVTAAVTGTPAVTGAVIAALLVNVALFFTAFRMLTTRDVRTTDLLPGVLFGAVLWQLLGHLGGYYVDHVVRHAKETSGLFAFVLGLLTWLYLGGQATMLAAEVNVVRTLRLWPRSLGAELLDADRKALRSSAEVEQRVEEEEVRVSFHRRR